MSLPIVNQNKGVVVDMKYVGLLLIVAGIAVGFGGLYLLFGFTPPFYFAVGIVLTISLIAVGLLLIPEKSIDDSEIT